MHESLKGLFYRIFIDPLLKSLRCKVAAMIEPGEKVIDIACGTGALSLTSARHAGHVTGIDMSEGMITTARRMAQRQKTVNTSFELLDATDLSCYDNNSFDIAVSTLTLHQFEPEVGVKVLTEMKRVANRVIIADYNCPMTPGPAAWLSYVIERIAGGDHYHNFRQYMAGGGLPGLAEKAELNISGWEVSGAGVFLITLMSPKYKTKGFAKIDIIS